MPEIILMWLLTWGFTVHSLCDEIPPFQDMYMDRDLNAQRTKPSYSCFTLQPSYHLITTIITTKILKTSCWLLNRNQWTGSTVVWFYLEKHLRYTAVSSSKSGEECYFSRLSFCYKPNIQKAKVTILMCLSFFCIC